MASTTWTYAQDVYASFQASRSDLETRLAAFKSQPKSTSSDELQALAVELAKLSKTLTDATGSLPSYDQRQCELQLKTLEKDLDDLRAAGAPQSKFAFKRKAKAVVAPASQSAEPSPEIAPIPSTPAPAPTTSSTNITLSSHSHKHLTLASLPSALPGARPSDLTLADLDGCIINLLPGHQNGRADEPGTRISALHVRNVANSVLLLPPLPGSALLHDMRRCVVAVGCHQFRMHASTAVDVHLAIPSNPIIEHCSAIRFADYPSPLRPSPSSREYESKYASVQDFSHVRATPSPNWSLLQDAEGVRWLDLVIGGGKKLEPGSEVSGELLEGLLPKV